jgi:hypothetical protein
MKIRCKFCDEELELVYFFDGIGIIEQVALNFICPFCKRIQIISFIPTGAAGNLKAPKTEEVKKEEHDYFG